MWTAPRETPAAPSPNEEYCSLAIYHPPAGHKPNVLDDFHYSEPAEMIFQEKSSDQDTEPSYLCDAELDDETIGKALSSPLFTQEREEPADRRQAYHFHEESSLPAQSLFTHARMGRPYTNLRSCTRKSSREMDNERIGILRERQKSKFSLKSVQRFRNTSFKPILMEKVLRN